jgi:phytoene dehydrogenase-like protein
MDSEGSAHVVIVGGGLAGLTAAALAGRAGARVTVCERAGAIGGRAATHVRDDFHLNLGAHALYLGGAAARELAALGLPLAGGAPPSGWALRNGELHTLPTGAVSLLTTGLLSFGAKRRAGLLLSRLGSIDTDAIAGVSMAAWLDQHAPDPDLREFLGAVVRVSTYCADFAALSAGSAIAQIASAVDPGVRYLDGGWQSLVDGLAAAGRDARASIVEHAHVTAIAHIDALGRRAVSLADGRRLDADAVIVCASPQLAAQLAPSSRSLAAAARDARPVRAACLDLALQSLPRPRSRFALGIDHPLYFSVHSGAARLAPGDGAVVHAMRYLDGSAADETAESDLGALCDRMQPGWRERVVERRFLPRMIVAHDLPRATAGGLRGRHAVAVVDTPGLYVAGDWVGDEGMLTDCVVASAARAARLVAERLALREAA